MLKMCFNFSGINTSDGLSLSSPYWLLGIGDGFQSWTNRAAHCVTMLFSCRLGRRGVVSGYNTNGWPCTKVSMLYSLHVEHLFCWFLKKWQRIGVAKKVLLCVHTLLTMRFQWQLQMNAQVVGSSLISVYILDIVELFLVLNMHEIFAPGR